MKNLNITVEKILNHLNSADITGQAMKRVTERYNYSKSDLYHMIENVLIQEIQSMIKDYNEAGIYFIGMSYGNGNRKDRYFDIKYKYDNDSFTVIRFYYVVSCKLDRLNKWGISKLELSTNKDDQQEKTLSNLIHEAIQHIEDEKHNNKTVLLPQHIEKTKLLFDRVLKLMEQGENVLWSDSWELERVIKKYEELRGE